MAGVIQSVEAVAFRLPLRTPRSLTWFAAMESRESVLVRIRTDDGIEGIGDAVTSPYFTGESAKGAQAIIRDIMGPALIGLRAVDITSAVARTNQAVAHAPAAHAAVDIAMHDLAAKSLGVPLVDLLGGAHHERLPGTSHLFAQDTEIDAQEAAEAITKGFRILKVKVGKRTVREDLDRLAEIHRASEGKARIYVDANQAWSPADARAFAAEAGSVGVRLMEQPVRKTDFATMAALRTFAGPAVAPDEGVFGADDILQHIRYAAADAIVMKLIKTSGIRGAQLAIGTATAAGLPVYLAGMAGESSVVAAASIHVASATERLPLGVGFASHYVSHDIVTRPIAPVDGGFSVQQLTGPGLGVEIDEAALTECTI